MLCVVLTKKKNAYDNLKNINSDMLNLCLQARNGNLRNFYT